MKRDDLLSRRYETDHTFHRDSQLDRYIHGQARIRELLLPTGDEVWPEMPVYLMSGQRYSIHRYLRLSAVKN